MNLSAGQEFQRACAKPLAIEMALRAGQKHLERLMQNFAGEVGNVHNDEVRQVSFT